MICFMVLRGWREIGEHFSSGVATVIRWQSDGLPVHRRGTNHRGSVIAYSEEVDAWLNKSSLWTNDGFSQSSVIARRAAGAHWQKQRRREAKVQILGRLLCFQEKAEAILALCTDSEFRNDHRTRVLTLSRHLKRELEIEAKHVEDSSEQDVTGLQRALYSPAIYDALMLLEGVFEQAEVESSDCRCDAVSALLRHLENSHASLEKLR